MRRRSRLRRAQQRRLAQPAWPRRKPSAHWRWRLSCRTSLGSRSLPPRQLSARGRQTGAETGRSEQPSEGGRTRRLTPRSPRFVPLSTSVPFPVGTPNHGTPPPKHRPKRLGTEGHPLSSSGLPPSPASWLPLTTRGGGRRGEAAHAERFWFGGTARGRPPQVFIDANGQLGTVPGVPVGGDSVAQFGSLEQRVGAQFDGATATDPAPTAAVAGPTAAVTRPTAAVAGPRAGDCGPAYHARAAGTAAGACGGRPLARGDFPVLLPPTRASPLCEDDAEFRHRETVASPRDDGEPAARRIAACSALPHLLV